MIIRRARNKSSQKKRSASVERAIAQLERWASTNARLTLILPRGTNVVHHRGHLRKGEPETFQHFEFVCDSGMLVYFAPEQWVRVEIDHVPNLCDAIHVHGKSPEEAFTLNDRRLASLDDEGFTQLRAWATAKAVVRLWSGNSTTLILAGRLIGTEKNDVFLLQPLEGTTTHMLIDPRSADWMRVHKRNGAPTVVLSSGTNFTYLAEVKGLPDPLSVLPSASDLIH